jgi:hypothetical protein
MFTRLHLPWAFVVTPTQGMPLVHLARKEDHRKTVTNSAALFLPDPCLRGLRLFVISQQTGNFREPLIKWFQIFKGRGVDMLFMRVPKPLVFSLILALVFSGCCFAAGEESMRNILEEHDPTAETVGVPEVEGASTTADPSETNAPANTEGPSSSPNTPDALGVSPAAQLTELIRSLFQLIPIFLSGLFHLPSTFEVIFIQAIFAPEGILGDAKDPGFPNTGVKTFPGEKDSGAPDTTATPSSGETSKPTDNVEAGNTAETPSTGNGSGTADTPSTGDAPATTDTPSTGDAPATANTPSTGDAPATANTPSTGDAPATTDTPSTGDAPATANTPSTGNAPGTAETPSTGDAPSSGKSPGDSPTADTPATPSSDPVVNAPATGDGEEAPRSDAVPAPSGETPASTGGVGAARQVLRNTPGQPLTISGHTIMVHGATPQEMATIRQTLERLPSTHVACIHRIAIGDTRTGSRGPASSTGGNTFSDGDNRYSIEMTHTSFTPEYLRRIDPQTGVPDNQLVSGGLMHETAHCASQKMGLSVGATDNNLGNVVYHGGNRGAGTDPRGGAFERFADAYRYYHLDPEGFRRRDPEAARTVEQCMERAEARRQRR